jgi:hypothetical protein
VLGAEAHTHTWLFAASAPIRILSHFSIVFDEGNLRRNSRLAAAACCCQRVYVPYAEKKQVAYQLIGSKYRPLLFLQLWPPVNRSAFFSRTQRLLTEVLTDAAPCALACPLGAS